MLTELFRGKNDLADWRDDPAYQDAKATEDEAAHTVNALKATADRLWAAAQEGSEIARLPSPGNPCWAARELWLAADRVWEDAKKARAQAEEHAKQAVQQAGELAGRDLWNEAEREVFPRLIEWTRKYEAARVEIRDKTDVKLPEIACGVCLTPEDLSTFVENARRSFGS